MTAAGTPEAGERPTTFEPADRTAWELRRGGMTWAALASEFDEPPAYVRLRCERYERATDAAAAAEQVPLF